MYVNVNTDTGTTTAQTSVNAKDTALCMLADAVQCQLLLRVILDPETRRVTLRVGVEEHGYFDGVATSCTPASNHPKAWAALDHKLLDRLFNATNVVPKEAIELLRQSPLVADQLRQMVARARHAVTEHQRKLHTNTYLRAWYDQIALAC